MKFYSSQLLVSLVLLTVPNATWGHSLTDNDSLNQLPRFQKSFTIIAETGSMIRNKTDWGREINRDLNYKALDFRLGFRSTKPTVYNSIYRYPTYGLGLYTVTFKNQYIGKPNALYLFLDMPIEKSFLDERLSFGYFAAFGIALNFKPFHPEENPNNRFIGSYENSYSHFGFTMRYQLGPHFDLEGSIGLKHFSNGSMRKPNSGLNFVPFALGLKTNLEKVSFPVVNVYEPEPFKPNRQINIALYGGGKNYEVGESQYFKLGMGVNYMLQFHYKYRFGLGMDMFFSGAVTQRTGMSSLSFSDRTSYAAVGSWEWVLSERVYIPMAFGTYLHRNEFNHENSWFYERIGLRYRLPNHLFAGISIKAHGIRADFFEWTLGYSVFRSREK